MKNKTLFIFDVDGTLVDAYRAIQKSLNFTLKKFGHSSVSYEKTKKNVGKGDRKFIGAFFKDSEIQSALKIFKKHHEKAVSNHSKVLPYARMVLYRLKQKGKKIAVATNRPRKFTMLILRALDLVKYFDVILCADEIKRLKPHPKILNTLLKKFKVSKKEAVFIGDMGIDLETAHRAKIDAVFVKGGSGDLRSIRKYKNKKVINSLKSLLGK